MAKNEKGGGLHSPPFFELVDRIPTAVLAGLLALALIALAVWAAWVRTRRRLDHNAFVDPITGIANAAAFESLLGSELERAKRFKRPLGLLVLEVSGHERAASGLLALRDQTLRDVTRGIQERIRSADTVARLGESRFAVISPEATAASVETMARALELRLEEFRVHVKVGVAERMAADLGPQDLLARAGSSLASPDPTPSSPSRVERSAVLRAA